MDRSAADFLPEDRSLTSLRHAASGCRGCDLWKDATETAFGQGRSRAELMLAEAGVLQGVWEAMHEGAGEPA